MSFVLKTLSRLVDIAVTLIELLLGLRLLFKLFAGGSSNTFVTWIYSTSSSLLTPFQGLFPTTRIAPGLELEFSTLFAIVTYALLGWIIVELLSYLKSSRRLPERKV